MKKSIFKVIKKLLKILSWTGAGGLVLLLLTFLFIRLPSVQQWLSQRIAAALSEELDTQVSITGFFISGFRDITVENLYVEDHHQDTLAYIHHLKCGINDYRLDTFRLELDDIIVEGACFHIRRYAPDSLLNIQFLLDAFGTDTSGPVPWSVQCQSLALENAHFIYDDQHKTVLDSVFDPAHVHSNLSASITEIAISGDSIGAHIDNISMREKSGIDLRSMEGVFFSLPGTTGIRHMHLCYGRSSLTGYCSLFHHDYASFGHFIDSVDWRLVLDTARLYAGDFRAFVPSLDPLPHSFALSGRMTGPVSDMHFRQIHLSGTGGIDLSANADISGLPNFEESFVMMEIKNLSAGNHVFDSIPLPPFSEHKYYDSPDILHRLGQIKLSGEVTGFVNDFVAFTKIECGAGRLSTDINMKRDTGTQWTMSGKLVTGNLNAAQVLEDKDLGLVSLESAVLANIGGEETKVNFDAEVSSLEFKGHPYSDLVVKGNYDDGKLSASIVSGDPAAKLSGNGVVDFGSPATMTLNAQVAIKHFDLRETKILMHDSLVVSGDVDVNIDGFDFDNNMASISIDSLICQKGRNKLESSFIKIEAEGPNSNRLITLYSDIAEAKLSGSYSVDEFPDAFASLLSGTFSVLYNSEKEINSKDDFNVSINGGPMFEDAVRLFVPLLDSIAGFHVNFGLNSAEEYSELVVRTSRLILKGMLVDDLVINTSLRGDSLKTECSAKTFHINDSLWLGDLSMGAVIHNDTGDLKIAWNNKTAKAMKGEFNAQIGIDSLKRAAISLSKSFVTLADSTWNVESPGPLWVRPDGFLIENLRLSKGREQLVLNADLKHKANDQIKLELANIGLNNLNRFIPSVTVQVKGSVDGHLRLADPYGKPLLSAGLNLKQISLDSNLIGDGKLQATYDDKLDRVRFSGGLTNRNRHIFSIRGQYDPSDKTDNLDADIHFKRLPFTVLQPILKDYLGALDGVATGDVKVTGTPGKPVLRGALDLGPSRFFVNYTHCAYTIPGAHIMIDNDLIAFDQISLYDRFHHEAKINGTILHREFRAFNFDLSTEMNDFQCLDTRAEDNPDYYGDARLSGMANIFGYADNLTIEAILKTEHNTTFFIPLDNPEEVNEFSYISFLSSDTALAEIGKHHTVDLSGIQMNLAMEITPDADVEILFDETVGDVIKGKAEGNLRLEINTSGNFNMFGTLGIVKGDYLFTLENVINKRFAVEPGSSITWNGDPLNAEVDLDAVYRLKAPLYDITGVASREGHHRIPVDVHLLMTRAMSAPDIAFDIQLPGADESVQRELGNVLTNEQEINKQVFSLLMLNRFMPPPSISSAQESRTGVGGTTSSELLSNQLSNWLSAISKQVDVGVNYRPGDDINSDELEVALSTQLFNDRLELETNVGISDDNKNVGNSSLAGDFRVEYKITDDGSFRALAYNKSNDESVIASTNNARYTQGAGLSYAQDFDTWREFFEAIKHVSVMRKKDDQ